MPMGMGCQIVSMNVQLTSERRYQVYAAVIESMKMLTVMGKPIVLIDALTIV